MGNGEFNLWHYTTLSGLEGIISSQCLWATDYRYLNDSSELLYSKVFLHQELLPRVIVKTEKAYKDYPKAKVIIDSQGGVNSHAEMLTREALKRLYDSFLHSPNTKPLPCVLSFCKTTTEGLLQKNGLLSQWRGYGKDGGYAVIFNMQKLFDEFEKDREQFYHGVSDHGDIVYAPPVDDDRIKECLDQVSAYVYQCFQEERRREMKVEEFDAIIKTMMLIKHIGFVEENEYRFFIVPSSESDKALEGFVEYKDKKFKQIEFRKSSKGMVPYTKLFERSKRLPNDPLPIEGVCIGPHKDKELRRQSIKTYLRTKGLEHINVFCSDIPFVG